MCWLRCITLSHSNFPTILGGGNISQCSLVQSEHVAEPGFNLDPLAQTANFIHPHQVDANIISIWLFLLCCHVQLFVTPCPPGSSVHGIFQARILKWVAISSYRGSSQLRDLLHLLHLQADTFTTVPPGKPNERLN